MDVALSPLWDSNRSSPITPSTHPFVLWNAGQPSDNQPLPPIHRACPQPPTTERNCSRSTVPSVRRGLGDPEMAALAASRPPEAVQASEKERADPTSPSDRGKLFHLPLFPAQDASLPLNPSVSPLRRCLPDHFSEPKRCRLAAQIQNPELARHSFHPQSSEVHPNHGHLGPRAPETATTGHPRAHHGSRAAADVSRETCRGLREWTDD